jgi:hypothetical protein
VGTENLDTLEDAAAVTLPQLIAAIVFILSNSYLAIFQPLPSKSSRWGMPFFLQRQKAAHNLYKLDYLTTKHRKLINENPSNRVQ